MLEDLEQLIDKFIELYLKDNPRNGLGKLKEEVNEFVDDPNIEEGVDVLICVMIELRRRGYSLDNLIIATIGKMVINLSRTWEVQPDGTLHHV